ncbi:MAG: flagellar assembly peptidoglycan hydrolase FlgJ [Herminiimonas sp.]|nr:flagellar assembly peptidoglycan hydrolase FlgJ [Herminiimonas sp.]
MITSPTTASGASFSIDPKEIDALRQSARQNSPDAIKAVAKQFEGLFLNMVMKSMRAATPQDGIMDSEQGKMFTSMLDQQMSQNLAKRGVGLADVLIRQLSANRGVQPGAADAPAAGAVDPALPGAPQVGVQAQARAAAGSSGFQANLQQALESGIPGVLKAVLTGVRPAVAPGLNAVATVDAGIDSKRRSAQAPHVRAFEERLSAPAEEASRATGIPAKFMLGQAALESGWGKREILTADGSSSHNVFGIKAGAGWKGKVVETATTEYVNGVPERRIERFRAYDSYGDAFRDYAKTLTNNPRYQTVLANAQDLKGFAQGLQRAGYATDPNYAAKLTRIITHSLSA